MTAAEGIRTPYKALCIFPAPARTVNTVLAGSAGNDFLLDKHGLSATRIAERVHAHAHGRGGPAALGLQGVAEDLEDADLG